MAAPWDPSLAEPLAVAQRLGGDPVRGLSAAAAAERLAAEGPNALRAAPATPWWVTLLAQLRNPLVALLGLAITISLVTWAVEGARGVPVDALVIAAIVVANAALGLAQARSAEAAVAALSAMTAATATVVRDGRTRTIPAAEVVRGDLLHLAEGDSVAADGRLVLAAGLKTQEASLTGESASVVKQTAALPEPAALPDRDNMVFKGTAVVQGSGLALVTATGMATQVGAIADLLATTRPQPSPLTRHIESVSRSLGLAVGGIAVVVMAGLAAVNGLHSVDDAVDILLLGVALAVAAVPEGLPAVLSLVLAIGTRDLARRHAVVRHLYSVESLGSASVICSDKTGTLTQNQMTLRLVATPSGVVEFTGDGYVPEGAPLTGDAALLAEARRVLVGGVLASNARHWEQDGAWQVAGDPTEAAFLVAQHKLPGTAARVADFVREGEVPFTSQRKLMSVVSHDNTALTSRLYTKGAPDILLDRCCALRKGETAVPLDDATRADLHRLIERLSHQGFRTLAVAVRSAGEERGADLDESAEYDLEWLGMVGLIDPPRAEAPAAVAQARRAGVRTIMITGDHPATAARVAADLGIADPSARALSGPELDRLTPADLAEAVRDVSVFARVAPVHKLRIVEALQSHGEVVAMTGDGVNDAPALKAADIGVAMGIAGTEVAKQAAAMILTDDNYATIVAAVHRGRVIYDNIAKFLRYLLSSNLGEVATVFLGVAFADVLGLRAATPNGLVVPLLATQILWINLVTDAAPALAMGVDPEIDDVMARPPRDRQARLLDRPMWLQVGWIGTVMACATLLTLDAFLPGGLIAGHHDLVTARTAAFTTLVLAQLFNALNSRSASASAFRGLFTNPWLWGAILVGALAQVAVVEVPLLQRAFGTTGLAPADWLFVIAMSSAVLWTEEITKLLRRGWMTSR